MKKPDFTALPREFRAEYAKFAALRLAGSALFLAAAAAGSFLLDFSGLKYPAMGPVFLFAAALADQRVLDDGIFDACFTERFAELGVLIDGDAFVLYKHAGCRAAHFIRKGFHDCFLLL